METIADFSRNVAARRTLRDWQDYWGPPKASFFLQQSGRKTFSGLEKVGKVSLKPSGNGQRATAISSYGMPTRCDVVPFINRRCAISRPNARRYLFRSCSANPAGHNDTVTNKITTDAIQTKCELLGRLPTGHRPLKRESYIVMRNKIERRLPTQDSPTRCGALAIELASWQPVLTTAYRTWLVGHCFAWQYESALFLILFLNTVSRA
jgi:hypothetical protein